MSRKARTQLLLAAALVLTLALEGCADSKGTSAATASGSWERLGQAIGGIPHALVVDPVDPATAYLGTTQGGVFKSEDGGVTWTPRNEGLGDPSIHALLIDPSSPATIYAGTALSGVFKTTDAGLSWYSANTGLTDEAILALAVDPSETDILYVGTEYGGVFRSDDGAGRWTPANEGLPLGPGLNMTALAVDHSAPGTIYAGAASPSGGEGDGVFKTTDGGQSWSRVSEGINLASGSSVFELAIATSQPSTIQAVTGCLDDDLCSDTHIFNTTNGGNTWQGSLIIQSVGYHIEALAVQPLDSDVLFAAHPTRGVFATMDGGRTWSLVNAGLTNTLVYVVAIAPSEPNAIYAVTASGGIFAFQE